MSLNGKTHPATENCRLVSRSAGQPDTVVNISGIAVGGTGFVVIAGPCAVESSEQIERCAEIARDCGASFLRGGCFKPRTSPYSFQGMGREGLAILREAGQKFSLPVITEILSHDQIDEILEFSDVLQIGARNMQNFPLLKAAGRAGRPVLLKRGMSASIEELLLAAEYILAQGNTQVILCERGIRTFETETRYTLDIGAIPVLRLRTHLPVIVDPSHAAGRSDIVPALAMAARAAGAHGVMLEIHPDPAHALSDGPQSLNFVQFRKCMLELSPNAQL